VYPRPPKTGGLSKKKGGGNMSKFVNTLAKGFANAVVKFGRRFGMKRIKRPGTKKRRN